jgi:demethylmenaquinone methyltransferase/2-methoxy-6-polyprenyl-1,4-benzoquinol methylase
MTDRLPPHTPLPACYGDEIEHERFVRRMFDDTAPDYDRIERVLADRAPASRRLRVMRYFRRSVIQELELARASCA